MRDGDHMTMTREEIDREVTQLTMGRTAPAHGRPTLVAFLQFKNGLPIDQSCPYCQQTLRVDEHGSAWTVTCPCGKSTHSLRGFYCGQAPTNRIKQAARIQMRSASGKSVINNQPRMRARRSIS